MTELEKRDFVMDIVDELDRLQTRIYGIDREILGLDAKDELSCKLHELKTVLIQKEDEFVVKHWDEIEKQIDEEFDRHYW